MSARDDLLRFLVNYGGRCRDCADEFGVCPLTGVGCGERAKAAEHFLSAFEYGSKHGFASGYTIAGPGDRVVKAGEIDAETVERAACIADTAHEKIIAPRRDRETAFAVGELVSTAIRSLTKEAEG